MDMTNPFHEKLCVITGAGSGIGRALALDLAGRGAALALSDIDEAGLGETRALIEQTGSNRMRFDKLDVADADAIEKYAAAIKGSLGSADYVFNVAGLTRLGAFEASPLSSFEKIMDVNFWGVVRMSKAFLPQLIETRGGLVNISSIFGVIGFPGQSHYCASKFAVRGFSETIAQELQDRGVSVTSVHPGGVATNIARNAKLDALPPGFKSREKFDKKFDKAAHTSPAKAAQIILKGAAKGKRRVMVGVDAHFISLIQRVFPRGYTKMIGWLLPNSNT